MSTPFSPARPPGRPVPLPFPLTPRPDEAGPPDKSHSEAGAVILLDPGWEYVRTVKNSPRDLHLEVRPTSSAPCCRHCGALPLLLSLHGRSRLLFVKDTPVGGKRLRLYYRRRRYLCSGCGKTTQQPLSGISKHKGLTQRLVAFVEREVFDSRNTYTKVADTTGISEKMVRDIFTDLGEELIRSVRIEAPEYIGMDGVYVGGKRCCVITDLVTGRIIGLLEESHSVAVAKYLVQLRGREQVKGVSIDLSWPFAKAARKYLPQAKIIADTFHVQRLANRDLHDALKSLGKIKRFRKCKKEWMEERASSKRQDDKDKKVKRTRFLLFKRYSDLAPKEKSTLEKWVKEIPELGRWYFLKEKFLNIFQCFDRQEAESRYARWEQRVERELPAAFRKLRKSIRMWHTAVFNYFDERVTNASTEALNGNIKTMQRVGRGYKLAVLRTRLLYAEPTERRKKPRRKKKARRKETPKINPNSNVERLNRAFKEQDQVGEPINPAEVEGWASRFESVKEWMKGREETGGEAPAADQVRGGTYAQSVLFEL